MSVHEKIKVGKYEIDIPKNGISEVGIQEVQRFITRCLKLPRLPEWWCWDWTVTGKGEYVGAFPKRVSKYYWTQHKKRISEGDRSEIGNIGQTHCAKNTFYRFDITDKFEWNPGEFGDRGSCFWGCRNAAREVLEVAGTYALRLFDKNNMGYARCWLSVSKELDSVIMFNSYGQDLIQMARIMSCYLDFSYYKKILLTNGGETDGLIFVNGGNAFLVGPQEKVSNVKRLDLQIKTGKCHCDGCGEFTTSGHQSGEFYFCVGCMEWMFCNCRNCGDEFSHHEMMMDARQNMLCSACFATKVKPCLNCDLPVFYADQYRVGEDIYCSDCFSTMFGRCHRCGKCVRKESLVRRKINGRYYMICPECAIELHKENAEKKKNQEERVDNNANATPTLKQVCSTATGITWNFS